MASITASAAFVAAGLSLVNVIVSYLLSRRRQLSQWRRDSERPIVVNVLSLSRELRSRLSTVAMERTKWLTSIHQSGDNESAAARDAAASKWQMGWDTFEELRHEVTGLDLIAGPSPRETAARLVSAHKSLVHWLRPASGTSEPPGETFAKLSNSIAQAEQDLISAVRQDIGVDGPAGFARWFGRSA